LDEDAQAADLLQEYEAKIAALERMAIADSCTATKDADGSQGFSRSRGQRGPLQKGAIPLARP
jgi:hypothetical protein